MKSMEAKVGAFVVLCAVILMRTVYYVSYARFKGARVPFRTYLKDAEGLNQARRSCLEELLWAKLPQSHPTR